LSITERLAILVDLNTDDAVRAMGRLEDSAKRSLQDGVESRMDRVGDSMTRVGGMMMGVGAAAATGLVLAADKTRMLEDQTARAEQTFGAAFGTLQQEAEDAVDTLGISERAFLDANSSIGVFGRGAGMAGSELAGFTTEIVAVTRDLASFTGASFEEGIDAIGAAFRGEFDSVERFGIQLNETRIQAEAADRGMGTLEKGSREYLELVRDLIVEQADATGALGDYERTSDSATNTQQRLNAQWENFQAQLGEGVLPIMTQVLDTGSRMLGFVNDLDEDTGGMVSTVGTWTTGLLLVGGALSTAVGQVIKFRDNIRTATTALNNHKAAAAGAAGALALITTAYLEYRRSRDAGESQADAFNSTLEETGDKAVSAAAALESLKDQFPDLQGAMSDAGVSAAELESAMLAGGSELESVLLRLVEGGQLLAGENEMFSRTLVNLSNDIRDTVEAGNLFSDTTATMIRWIREAAGASGEYSAAVDETGAQIDETNEASRSYKESVDELVEAVNNAFTVEIDYREAVRATFEALEEVKTAQGDVNDVTSDAAEAHDNAMLAIMSQADAYVDMKREQGDTRSDTDLMVEALTALATYVDGPLRDAVNRYIDDLNRIPDNITTNVTINTHSGSPTNKGNAIIYGDASGLPQGAVGAVVNRPTIALIGEAGPEAVVPLNRTQGNQPLPSAMSSQTSMVRVSVAPGLYSGDELVAMLRDIQDRFGFVPIVAERAVSAAN